MRPDGDAFLESTEPVGRQDHVVGRDRRRAPPGVPTGETIEVTQGPDPRWGFYVQVPRKLVRRSPSGRTQTTTGERAVTLADDTDPLSLQTITDTVTTNGRKSVLSYDVAARRETAHLARGADRDDVLRRQGPRRARSSPARASRRSPTRTTPRACSGAPTQGSRFYRWEYDARDRPAVGIDNTGRRTELTYDDADRIVAIKRPGGGTERFEYDAEGARTAVVLPGGQRHVLKRDARGALSAYDPLAGADFERSHDGDGRLTADGVAGDQTPTATRTAARRARPGPTARSSTATTAPLDRPSTLTRTPAGAAPPSGTRSRSTARRPPASPPPARPRARSRSATTTTGS